MLYIVIPADEGFDERTNKFVKLNQPVSLQLEHSLVSVAKWESKYHKSFFDDTVQKSEEELIQYFKFMTITQNVPNEVYERIKKHVSVAKEINDYINNPMTATTFNNKRKETPAKGIKNTYITNEQIYSAMARFSIPFSCEKWHLNRLLTLIKVRRIEESGDSNKMGKKESMDQLRSAKAAARANYRHPHK